MTQDDFRRHMARLAEQFKNIYSPARVDLIWHAVKYREVAWWSRTVDDFIGNCRQAPLLPEIREAAQCYGTRGQVKDISLGKDGKYRIDCEVCTDNGVYICTRKDHGGFWAFRCHCVRGSQDARRHLPQFNAVHAAEYTAFDIEEYRRQTCIVELGRPENVS